ncbi:hypothetical protein [Streptomyces sp. NPDC056948]|uniref:hypothetical protein n=1 Tax=Streptomyces sp. NPDC056948 TaxID=3345975 RepID=UPI00362EBF80
MRRTTPPGRPSVGGFRPGGSGSTGGRARLVELDPRNVEVAAGAARAAALRDVEAVVADAALLDHYDGMAPADLVPRGLRQAPGLT